MDAARTWRLARISIALVMLWCLALAAAFALWGSQEWLPALGRLDGVLLASGAALFAANHGLRFVRWHAMLAVEGCAPPVGRSLAIFMAGLALQPTPAKAGIAVRSVLLLPLGVPAHVSLAAYFSERLLDFIGLAMLAVLALGTAGSGTRVLMAAAVGVAATVAVFTARAWLSWLREVAWLPGAAKRALAWLARFMDDASTMLRGVRFLAFLAMGTVANACTGVMLWLVLRDLGAPIELLRAAGIVGVSHLSGSISLLPGGLGGFELAMLAQLSLLGVTAAAAIVALAAVRIMSFWSGVLVGMPLLWIELRRLAPATGT